MVPTRGHWAVRGLPWTGGQQGSNRIVAVGAACGRREDGRGLRVPGRAARSAQGRPRIHRTGRQAGRRTVHRLDSERVDRIRPDRAP
ncbi:hypothetical protein SBRY_20766 [Actinacidiphila bryophytorum]|uniref:Uncharacterized protein n=1 Tax=Actinacidiphila bryophytorum TaxID=1436133 RepID=A0A9W4E805_9ACTN|nr:hypothetical protein SBRY_20766 [Actinacidiphila bryophytorum]